MLKYTIVYEKEPFEGMTDKRFYNNRIKYAKHQKDRLTSLEKSFHKFHVLGLDEFGDLEVVSSFVFPRLLTNEQQLFISNDGKKLLEITN